MSHEKAASGSGHGHHARSDWHRRLALGLSAQLPDDPEDARAVLDCVAELVETFLYPRPGRGVESAGAEPQERVLRLAGAAGGISSCRTR